jgi:autotransporter translocation and assembly factor TamB
LLCARAIDLAVLRPLMPQGQQIAGDLSAEILIIGTSTAPLIEANLSVNGLVMNSQRLGDLNARTNYRPSTAALDVTLHQDQNHQLSLNGDIPVSLNWAHGFAATIGNNQKIRVYSAGIRLAPFGGVAPKTLRNVAGLLQADLELTGPPLHPAINGTLAIGGGGAEVVPIGVTVTDFEMRLLASPTSIKIAELSAKAGDGTLSGSGLIALHDNYSPGAINTSLQIHEWPAIATQQYNAKINGEIHASGTSEAPHIQGEMDVVDTNYSSKPGFSKRIFGVSAGQHDRCHSAWGNDFARPRCNVIPHAGDFIGPTCRQPNVQKSGYECESQYSPKHLDSP